MAEKKLENLSNLIINIVPAAHSSSAIPEE